MILCRAIFSLLVISLLGACAALAPGQDAATRSTPFDMLGRVLVSYDGRAFSSSVRWWHGEQYDELWLMTPAGQTLAHLREDSMGATITSTDQTAYHGSSAEALTRQALGWEFPLARLQHWVRGMPAPNSVADIAERDSAGRITRMAQEGWRIRCEYSAAPEYEDLPRRIEVTGAAQSIRLVIDRWRRESQSNESSQGISITQ